ncbi:hypothetical protein [Peribacillus loiseleuriae]|uniref:hypothetical protein n=1 Tax=Peribacillus loiseleuriae TaxID=1679170 RepID=UPI003CFD23AB
MEYANEGIQESNNTNLWSEEERLVFSKILQTWIESEGSQSYEIYINVRKRNKEFLETQNN